MVQENSEHFWFFLMGKTSYSDFDKKKTEKTCKTVLPSEEEKGKKKRMALPVY
jgi:hypothetical protein